MNKIINIRLYADSLGLPRHGVVLNEDRYINLFATWLIQNKGYFKANVIDRSKTRSIVHNLYATYIEDNSYFEPSDILIIHNGICDCAPRPIPERLRNIISKLPSFLKERIIQLIHNHRASILKYGLKFYLTPIVTFEENYEKWLNDLLKTNTKVFIFNIAPTNDKNENKSPGFRESIDNYNSSFYRLEKKYSQSNIHFIDVHKAILKNENINDYIIEEDGHHITKLAHKLYFELLVQNLKID